MRSGVKSILMFCAVAVFMAYANTLFAQQIGSTVGPTVEPMLPPSPVTAEAKALVALVQDYYKKSGNFSAAFEQSYISKMTMREQKSEGMVHFAAPKMMRWEYEKPERTVMVTDGARAWYADFERKELKIYDNFKSSYMERSLAFLWGSGDLLADYTIVIVNEKRVEDLVDAGSRTVIEAVPIESNAQFEIIYLFIDPASGRIEEVLWFDAMGNSNNLRFKDVKTGQKWAVDFFSFKAPGSDWVVENLKF